MLLVVHKNITLQLLLVSTVDLQIEYMFYLNLVGHIIWVDAYYVTNFS